MKYAFFSSGSLVTHCELGAGRQLGGDLLAAQTEDTVLVEQHLVEKHQLVLDLDRESRAALAALDQDQLLEIFFALGIAPQAGDGLGNAGKRLDRGRFAGALALEHFALAEKLLREGRVDDSVIYCHECRNIFLLTERLCAMPLPVPNSSCIALEAIEKVYLYYK